MPPAALVRLSRAAVRGLEQGCARFDPVQQLSLRRRVGEAIVAEKRRRRRSSGWASVTFSSGSEAGANLC